MDRRGFLRGILAAGMAPAVVKAGILMPVKEIIVPRGLRGQTKHLYALDELGWFPAKLDDDMVVEGHNLVMTGEIGTIYGMSIVVDRSDVKGFVRNPRRNHSFMRMSKKRVDSVMVSHPDMWMDIIGRPA